VGKSKKIILRKGGYMLKEEIIAKMLRIIGRELTEKSGINDGDNLEEVKEKTIKALRNLIKLWGG